MKFTPLVNFHFISVKFAWLKNWLEIVEERRKEKAKNEEKNMCHYMNMRGKVETKLERET